MRVVAVSAETSLAAALNMMDGWEVVFAHDLDDVDRVARTANVLLAGGGTEHGLGMIAELRGKGIDVPAVVLGDTPAPEATSTVLTPPFTLDELRSAVEGAVRDAQRTGGRPVASSSPAAPAAPERPEPAPVVAEPGLFEPHGTNGSGSHVDTRESPEPVVPKPPERAAVEAPPAEAPRPRQPAISREPLLPEEDAALVEQHAPAAVPEHERPEDVVLESAGSAAASVAPAPAQDQSQERVRRRRRWRGDKDEPGQPGGSSRGGSRQSVVARLHAAEQAARAVEAMLQEIPLLADLEVLGAALIGEVVEAFKPEVAALYLPAPASDGFWVAAGHELTPSERRMKGKADHPLFRELLGTGEPILIAPLDLARSMVTGVAGARTEALIAGPVLGTTGCVGIIVVGRDDFGDRDLDTLANLASEAAPGLAVAEALDRLRTFRA